MAPRRTHAALAAATLATLLPALARAGDPMMMAPGGVTAGPAAASPSALHWNPASMGLLEDHYLFGELNLTGRLGGFERDTTGVSDDGQVYDRVGLWSAGAQPMVGATRRLRDTGLTVGMALSTPLTDHSRWFDEAGEQRWFDIHSRLDSLAITPAVSYDLTDALHLGASVSLIRVWTRDYRAIDYGDFVRAQNEGADIPEEAPGNEGRALGRFKGNGSAIDLGLTWRPSDALTLGLVYAFGSEIFLDGDYSLYAPNNDYYQEDFGDAEEQDATLQTRIPDEARLGLHFDASERLTLRLNVEYTRWSMLRREVVDVGEVSGYGDATRVTRRAFNDSVHAHAGLTLRTSPTSRISLGAGFENNQLPDRYVGPDYIDGHTVDAALGLTRALSDRLELTLGYRHYFMIPRAIEETSRRPAPTGSYALNAGQLGANVTWRIPLVLMQDVE